MIPAVCSTNPPRGVANLRTESNKNYPAISWEAELRSPQLPSGSAPVRPSVIIAPDPIFDDTVYSPPMIFGFNTDIKHEDTIYHVQSEAREGEMLLQTQVFVRGRCIGKRATPYADQAQSPDFTDQKKEQILREQHRLALDPSRHALLAHGFDKRTTPETLAPESA